ncbi:hypothetical protein DRP05_04675 [Archaeoglobales archaeon]|nr:MAG: hypothetical protein DRO97_10765 [Archaeoglobales archaeon]RLI79189.1 MAG: hypothetical protein DRP05_04675 [Archaeoglobales archaeon]
MFYKNSYLEKMADVLQKKDVENLVKQLTNKEEIEKMFKSDGEYIVKTYRDGSITIDEAKKNFDLLKAYTLTQLKFHFERVKEMAEHFGVSYVDEGIDDELVERIMEMLVEYESKLE